MQSASIKNIALLEVMDGEQVHLGGDQDWYRSWWKRTAGCGPSTFANIIYYISRRSGRFAGPVCREDYIRLMEDVWKSVTPTMHGLSSTAAFVSGARDYISRIGLGFTAADLPVMKVVEGRPSLQDAAGFIANALLRDVPVAFLALDNGDEKRLDSWHWITILSIESRSDGAVRVRVLDNGKSDMIDLGRWLATTGRGGGFAAVY